ncbi:acyltransferase family protein [Agaribacter marinus]|uniref:acyltransferase family protein n=1 Tax=Agaribacter marinus TaxID=1431249 RepID=UPI0024E06B0F|nr:acyltransferase family protein [Agaribacter marinus]
MSIQHTRHYYLDAVRAFALLLGIVFHASLSFVPIFIGWAVMDINTSGVVSIFVFTSHAFRMPLFFLVAGFFTGLKLHQLGVSVFIKSRLTRIAIPFVIAWLILRPLLASGWVMGAESMQGEVNVWTGLLAGVNSLLNAPNDFLVGTHLWFLHYLLSITFAMILLKSLLSTDQHIYENVRKLILTIVTWLCSSTWGTLCLVICTSTVLWFMRGWNIDTPDKSLIPELPIFALYAGFFALGWVLQKHPVLLGKFMCLNWQKCFLCLISTIIGVSLSEYEGQSGHPHYYWLKALFLVCYAMMMWTYVMIAMRICRRFFYQANKVIQYISEASYSLYLVHLPIVIYLQIIFAELAFHWALKLLCICVITFVFSILLYDVLIRATIIGKVLNGKRKPSIILKYRYSSGVNS